MCETLAFASLTTNPHPARRMPHSARAGPNPEPTFQSRAVGGVFRRYAEDNVHAAVVSAERVYRVRLADLRWHPVRLSSHLPTRPRSPTAVLPAFVKPQLSNTH